MLISERAGEGLAELYASNSEDPYHLEDLNSRYFSKFISKWHKLTHLLLFHFFSCRYFKYPGACAVSTTSQLANASGIPPCPRRQRRPRKERYRKAYVPSTISSVTESRYAYRFDFGSDTISEA